MQNIDKKAAYEVLIQDVREFYLSLDTPTSQIYLQWCEDCHEINLWSYWQGSLDADIMVVGQDWGCPDDFEGCMANIRKINSGIETDYFSGIDDRISPTDRILIDLFHSIDIDARNRHPNLRRQGTVLCLDIGRLLW